MSDFPGRATLFDLYRHEGKAELIGGRIVVFPHLGWLPANLVMEITSHLKCFVEASRLPGNVFGGSLIYAVPPMASGRESFCPDSSYYHGPHPENRMSWLERPPTFAVEVRVEEDYESNTNPARAAKRSDYFKAGTQVVWDVDPLAETIACYQANALQSPVIFCRGDTADAEPAVPGWRLSVDALFNASNESR
jgi:Uma2 family endonuclease